MNKVFFLKEVKQIFLKNAFSYPRGDQTSAEAYLTVLPRAMECVVFSIDGSFAASVSIMGSDPKVRPGAVDVVRQVSGSF